MDKHGNSELPYRMPLFPRTPPRPTPYADFPFRVKWDNMYVLGVSHVSGLARSTRVIQHREGDIPSPIHFTPGPTSYGPITLERGVSYDVAFGQWVSRSLGWVSGGSATDQITAPIDFRRDLTIEVCDKAGVKVIVYIVRRAWISDCSAMAQPDGVGTALAIESMTLQSDGWEPLDSVDAAEPSFVLPART